MRMQEMFRRVIPYVYLFVCIICILMITRPGASIFYYQVVIKTEMIEPDDGYSYGYPLANNTLLSPANGILLYEGTQQLERAHYTKVANKGQGTYHLGDPDKNDYSIYFSSSDNSDPRTNGEQYFLYYPIVFFSRKMGFLYLFVLSLVLARVGAATLKSPERRRAVKESLIRSLKGSIPNDPDWKSLFILTIISAYLYAFMEWLFFVTKPSFMDISSFSGKLEIFFLTGFILSIISIVVLIVCAGVDLILSYLKLPRIAVVLGILIPTSIFTALSFLLIDNFTYTLFKFGVVSAEGIWRGVYGLLVLILFVYIYKKILEFLNLSGNAKKKWQVSNIPFYLVCSLLFLSAALAFISFGFFENVGTVQGAGNARQVSRRPNILLLGGDGLNARNLSVYGYARDTTPRIRELAQISLLAENAFPNTGSSTGSVTSILTGKLPTKTRVLAPPNILIGTDSFQHLPGLLMREGYRNVEIGVSHYVDAHTMNMQNAFDVVNGRSIDNGGAIIFLSKLGYYDTAYFLSRLGERIEDRLYHIFYVRRMENPYSIVTQPDEDQIVQDRTRIDYLLSLLTNTDDPLFIHVHLMATHGPKFFPDQRVFSNGKKQDEDWMTDFYDDAILTFDAYIGEVVDTLDKAGMLDNTIIIIYSDHAQKYYINVRIPLIFHFPGNEHQGRIQTNVQNLDIAPTILDYLGLPQPDWMSGRSLLTDNLQDHRLIFAFGSSVGQKEIDEGKFVLDVDHIHPPFYQFGVVNIIDCQRWYRIILEPFEWSSGEIEGHTSPCDENSLLTRDQIQQALYDHFSDAGFDISSLP